MGSKAASAGSKAASAGSKAVGSEAASVGSKAEPRPHWNVYDLNCPTRQVLDLIGSRWAVLVVGALARDTHRFGELRRAVGGVSTKVLTQVLRKLERDGLVSRRVYAQVPPRTDYRLTSLGESLIGSLAALRAWAEANIGSIYQARKTYDGVVEKPSAAP